MQFSCIGFVIYYRERGLETNGTRRHHRSFGSRNRSYRHRSSCDVYYYREMVLKYLKEITEWKDAPNTPNHTYIFDEDNACIGFIPTGTKKEIIFTQPIRNFAKSRRRFVELKNRESS